MLPLRGVTASRSGFSPAGGLAAGADSDRAQSRVVRPIGPLRPVLVVAGCDPALPLVEAPLGLVHVGGTPASFPGTTPR